MKMITTFRHGISGALMFAALAACSDDATGPDDIVLTDVAVVLNSNDRSLTVLPLTGEGAPYTIGVAPDGTPSTFAVRGNLAIVPLGTVPAAAVIDLVERIVLRTVALPIGSGATGAAFLNDSIAIVANSGLNSVSALNVRRGTAGAQIPVGTFPQAVYASGDTAYVLNAELGPDFKPARQGTITVLTGPNHTVAGTVQLSGFNPGAAARGSDGRIYVINTGAYDNTNGSLSILDPRTLTEVQHVPGFGGGPGGIAVHNGRVAVASFNYGVAIWDVATASFVRAPANAIEPGGIPASSGVGFDSGGRLYALEPDCSNPASAFRLTATFAVETELPVGNCPIGIIFTRLAETS